jgi:hypothetical protein
MVEKELLKAGNLVSFKGENFLIESIDYNNDRTDICLYNFSNMPFENKAYAKEEMLEFIPLNKEILSCLEFKINGGVNGSYVNQHKDCKSFYVLQGNYGFEFCIGYCKKIRYLHEFQNLFAIYHTKGLVMTDLYDLLLPRIFKYSEAC